MGDCPLLSHQSDGTLKKPLRVMESSIKLAHGNGGLENRELIEEIFFKSFKNQLLNGEDSAFIEGGKLAFTTDSFTVSPIFFNGGDIGKISICGTCNDIAMAGGKPKYLTCSVIVEEGFSRLSWRGLSRVIGQKEVGYKWVAGGWLARGITKGWSLKRAQVGLRTF